MKIVTVTETVFLEHVYGLDVAFADGRRALLKVDGGWGLNIAFCSPGSDVRHDTPGEQLIPTEYRR